MSGEIHYLSAFPELLVTDLDESLGWYREVLGFKPIADWPDGRHLRRADGQDIVLREAPTPVQPVERVILHFAIDGDLAELAARARSAGTETSYAREEDGWPEDLTLTDPDGHQFRFFARRVPTAAPRFSR